MIKKFDKDDILHNVLIANPKVSFRIFAGSVYSNSTVIEGLEAPYEPKLDFSDERNSMYVPVV